MLVKDKAIFLQNIKTGDKKSIVKLYTLSNGLVSCFAAVSKAPSSKIRASVLLPLNLLEVEYIIRQNKDVALLTEARSYFINNTYLNNFASLGILQFMNEVLIKILKEQQHNASLYNFIEQQIISLKNEEFNASTYVVEFLVDLTKYLGIEPQNNYSIQSPFFNSREGVFESVALIYPMGLDKETSQLLSMALSSNHTTIKYSALERKLLTDALLAYYGFHIPNFGNLKSIEILREIVAV